MLAQRFITDTPDGGHSIHLLVDGMHCPSCVAIIENALNKQPEVTAARLNLSTRRLTLAWKGASDLAERWVNLINGMGYHAAPFDADTAETEQAREEKFLLRCLAIAGFASMNLMMFSIPMWFADDIEMGAGTRTLFHWIQALIAIPAIAYSGLPFYRSAWRAVREYHANMDVPISVAVILATLMSLFETATHGTHAYFDSGIMLLFFLLIGRYLDARARGRARSAAHDLLQMMAGTATVLKADGSQETITLSEIQEGMSLRVTAGEKIGADGVITSGESELDTSLITGETMPQKVSIGAHVFAGTLNISAPLTLRVTKPGERSLLSEIIKLMETAEQSQARYVTIADKISSWYTPLVHILALATFLGWLFWGGAEWQVALLYAATVLIITCPCALGLAVPVVQVLASGKLMRQGILIKSGSALERLATITHVAFDKTGTLTRGMPELLASETFSDDVLTHAARLASHSKHPLSQALVRAATQRGLSLAMAETETVEEIPGCGLQQGETKLGKASWCEVALPAQSAPSEDTAQELWLTTPHQPPVRFTFADQLREDAANVIRTLQAAHLPTLLLSGDRVAAATSMAQAVGIADARGGLSPLEKCDVLAGLKAQGAHVLMVGDGLNDAPSLASAHVSMSPASAMDITQNAADIVFQGSKLAPVINAWNVARFSQKLVRENFILAILYNVIAIPMAVAGEVTPLVAAIAMSSSSLIVIANAMRLMRKK